MPMPDPSRHSVLRMWVRPEQDAPVVELNELHLVAAQGVRGDHAMGRMRHVTIIFEDDWRAAERDLGVTVDPSARRANVLVSGGGGARFVGQTIRLGGAVVEVKGITAPCPIMEKGAKGLEAALKPDGRSGVWGRLLEGATLRRGDELVGSTVAR